MAGSKDSAVANRQSRVQNAAMVNAVFLAMGCFSCVILGGTVMRLVLAKVYGHSLHFFQGRGRIIGVSLWYRVY